MGSVLRHLLRSELRIRRFLQTELRCGLRNLLGREARLAVVLVRARRADGESVEKLLRDAGAEHVELGAVRDLVRLDLGDELEILAENGRWNELRSRGANAVGAAAHEARHDAEGVGLFWAKEKKKKKNMVMMREGCGGEMRAAAGWRER